MFLKIFGVKILCWNKPRLLQICKFRSVYKGVESQYLKCQYTPELSTEACISFLGN
jgi:hypothetical protein